jgi:uncharacterized Fe-S radical SAM superfamily protein PflX
MSSIKETPPTSSGLASFITGMARIVDFSRTLSAHHYEPQKYGTDYKKLRSYWDIVGRNMQIAIRQHNEESETTHYGR